MCREIHILIEKQAFGISNPFDIVQHWNIGQDIDQDWNIGGNIENWNVEGGDIEVFEDEFEAFYNYISNIPKVVFVLYISVVLLIFVTIVSTFIIKDVDTILDNIIYICIYSSLHTFISIFYKSEKYDDLYKLYRTYLLTCILIYYHPILYLACIIIQLIDSYTKSVIPELFISIYGSFMGYNIYLSIMLWIIFIISYYYITP